MGAIERFQEVYEKRHDYARDWRERHRGGKILGYLCTYFPEEIAYAAGVLPVRLLGSHEIEHHSAPYIFGMYCPHCRDVLAQGIQGKYNYLDGIAGSNSCMHMLQAFESWARHVNPTCFRVDEPSSTQNAHVKDYLAQELECFKAEEMEPWVDKEITNDDLDHAIEVYNENRRLMKQVYELRKADSPPITGLEAMYMVVSGQFMDKEEHNALLKQALEELKDRELDREVGTRLMLVGSENDDPEFTGMIEQKMALPATVVIDDHCTGSRYFWNEVVLQQDRLHALASRYVDRPPCPIRDWPEHLRFKHILSLAKDWRADGAIVLQQKFCDPHEMDIPPLREYLQENGVPSYFLELDVTVPVGQFSTRIEAFIESIMTEIF